MNKTAIEWCDMTWNIVTGCWGPNGTPCPYCYARSIAKRFGGWTLPSGKTVHTMLEGETGVLDEPLEIMRGAGKLQKAPYPYDFAPTFHRYRLDEPQKVKKPQTIFVCSMADLFGEWVPDEWIKEVFDSCRKAPHHRFIFLSKNPMRYWQYEQYITTINNQGMTNMTPMAWPVPNIWIGATITAESEVVNMTHAFDLMCANKFLSLEPLREDVAEYIDFYSFEWILCGAETGSRKGKVIPERKWIESIVESCKDAETPLFMKNSLQSIWGEPLIQEYPW